MLLGFSSYQHWCTEEWEEGGDGPRQKDLLCLQQRLPCWETGHYHWYYLQLPVQCHKKQTAFYSVLLLFSDSQEATNFLITCTQAPFTAPVLCHCLSAQESKYFIMGKILSGKVRRQIVIHNFKYNLKNITYEHSMSET